MSQRYASWCTRPPLLKFAQLSAPRGADTPFIAVKLLDNVIRQSFTLGEAQEIPEYSSRTFTFPLPLFYPGNYLEYDTRGMRFTPHQKHL